MVVCIWFFIDKKGRWISLDALEAVAKRFMRRREIALMGLTLEDVKRILAAHAKRVGGCVSCAYSSPYHGNFSWTARHCVLGLQQGSCGMYKPILSSETAAEEAGKKG